MHQHHSALGRLRPLAAGSILTVFALLAATPARAEHGHRPRTNVQLGPRPFFLIDDLPPGPLKARLSRCEDGPFRPSDFPIGHRGAALQFPEHTRESYVAGARMGAGIITWTLERSGPLASGGGYYFQSVQSTIQRDSDALVLLDVLARRVGVRGVFSDWPATVTYHANCFGL